MKKYPTGLVPVDFYGVGKILFIIGVLCILAKVIDLLIGTFSISDTVFYFGLVSVLLSLYLIFAVPKRD